MTSTAEHTGTTSVDLPMAARRSLLTFVGLGGATAALTVVFYCMRAVMDIGGFCASGGPYEIAHPCPDGVPGLMVGAILGGLAMCGVYAFHAFGVNLVWLAWPALFLSLGWNFLEYGIDAPDGSGPAAGWLICAVLFILMGGVPLVVGVVWMARGRTGPSVGIATMRATLRPGSDPGRREHFDAWARAGHPRVYAVALQLVAIGAGIWAGIELYEWVTGSNIIIGFG